MFCCNWRQTPTPIALPQGGRFDSSLCAEENIESGFIRFIFFHLLQARHGECYFIDLVVLIIFNSNCFGKRIRKRTKLKNYEDTTIAPLGTVFILYNMLAVVSRHDKICPLSKILSRNPPFSSWVKIKYHDPHFPNFIISKFGMFIDRIWSVPIRNRAKGPGQC